MRYSRIFELSYRRCIFCGHCQYICPVDAIAHSIWEFKEDLILSKEQFWGFYLWEGI